MGYAWIAGAFESITVRERNVGGYKLAGLEYTGSYKKSGKFMEEVEKKLNDTGFTYNEGFGIYYDDPKNTPEDKCRSFIGGIIKDMDDDKISKLKAHGFRVDSVMKAPSIVVEFPIKSKASYMIGPMKAYPEISKRLSEKGHKSKLALEIYDIPQKKILYITQYE